MDVSSLLLVTVYFKMGFRLAIEVPPGKSKIAAMSPADGYSSTATCQTRSGL